MTMRFCWFMLLYVYVCWLWHSFQYVVIRTQLILMTSVDVVIYSCRSCASNLYVQLSAICISASYNDLIRCHQTISNVVVREFLPTHVLISVIWSLVKWHLIPDVQYYKQSSHKKIRRELVPGLISFWFPFLFFHPDWLKEKPPKKKTSAFLFAKASFWLVRLGIGEVHVLWHKTKHKGTWCLWNHSRKLPQICASFFTSKN